MNVGERVPYAVAARAQRQAHARAFAIEGVSLGDVKVLDAVLDATSSYSRLSARVAASQLARRAGVTVRTVRRSLGKLAEAGVVVYVPGLGAGNRSLVGVPPDSEKADAYLSALREADPAGFPPEKGDEQASSLGRSGASSFGAGKGTSTRAREGREEDLAGEGVAGPEVSGGPSGSSRGSDRETLVGGGTGDGERDRDPVEVTDRLLARLEERRSERARAAETHDGVSLTGAAPAPVVWPDTSSMTVEQAILADLEALVAAGAAWWVDPETAR